MSTSILSVINIEDLSDARTLRALDAASRCTGAFQAVGHGIPQRVQDELKNTMREFFNLSGEHKRSVARSENNHWGYYNRELTKNRVDLKEVYDYGRDYEESLSAKWPGELPYFQTAVENYFSVCEQVAFRIVSGLARNLGVKPPQLTRHFEPDNSSFLRLNYYPVRESRTMSGLGIHPHTDAGAVTLLLQDRQAGLEVFARDAWHLVEPIDGALVINLGDIVQVWSNDRYRAPLHRVVASRDRERYSAAFFFNPSFDTVYQPLPSTVDARHAAKYRAIHWSAFRAERAKGDYRDHGHEIQINDFRL